MKTTPFFVRCAALASLAFALPHDVASAPDNTRGMAMLSAVVSNTGQLLDGAGAVDVMGMQLGGGVYRVIFDRDVSTCYYVPTLSSRNFTFSAGSASAAPDEDLGNAVVVVTNIQNNVTDIAFHLLVFCNR